MVHGCFEPAVVPDVRDGGDDAPVAVFDELGRLGQILRGGHAVADSRDIGADVHGDDVGALLGQPDRV